MDWASSLTIMTSPRGASPASATGGQAVQTALGGGTEQEKAGRTKSGWARAARRVGRWAATSAAGMRAAPASGSMSCASWLAGPPASAPASRIKAAGRSKWGLTASAVEATRRTGVPARPA